MAVTCDTVSDLLHLRVLLVDIMNGLLLVRKLIAALFANRCGSLRLILLHFTLSSGVCVTHRLDETLLLTGAGSHLLVRGGRMLVTF